MTLRQLSSSDRWQKELSHTTSELSDKSKRSVSKRRVEKHNARQRDFDMNVSKVRDSCVAIQGNALNVGVFPFSALGVT
jgi:hypothetical protein